MSLRTDQIESWLESVDDYETGDWRPTKESFEWLCQLALKGLTNAKDADRYRFIRSGATFERGKLFIAQEGPAIVRVTLEYADRLIDAAMASQATPQVGGDGN